MGTLEDQLKKWKTTATPPPTAPNSKGAPTKAPAPTSKRAAKKRPLLTSIRREESPSSSTSAASSAQRAGAPRLTDAELFAAAVDGVSQDAVLDKFAAAPTVTVRGARLAPSAPKSDEELFTEFVGGVARKP